MASLLWKKVKTKHAKLIKLGLSVDKAWEYANTRKGYWHIANSWILSITLTNTYFEKAGLHGLSFFKIMQKGIFILLLAVFMSSCNSKRTEKDGNILSSSILSVNKENFSTGVVIPDVVTHGDSSCSYALYLPKDYNDSLRWPVIYFFDPHAAGSLPLRKYSPWAEQFGYVLFGSNDVKNELPGNELNRVIQKLFDDTYRRFSIDEKRIYTAGFSGGARVASSLALSNPVIRGVVACGGGFPSVNRIQPVHFDFLGFAGREDFNLPELMQLDTFLLTQPGRNYLIMFQGTHEWPDSLTFKDAFFWISFNEMKDRLIPGNDSLITLFTEVNWAIFQKMRKSSPVERINQLSKIISFVQGLKDVNRYKELRDRLYTERSFKVQKQQYADIFREETRLEKNYFQAFTTRNLSWWRVEIQHINRAIKESTGEKKYEYLRVLHYLSLAAYMQTEAGLRNHQEDAAAKYIAIYGLADPDNPYVYFLSALLYARSGQDEEAIKNLRLAIRLGFHDYILLIGKSEFDHLKKDPEFETLLNHLKQDSD